MTKIGAALQTSSSEVTSKSDSTLMTATHGNSESGSILIISHKLNGKNYLQWSQSVLMFISGKCKDEYLTGEIEIPEKGDPKYRLWKSDNNMIMSWLINSMNNDIGENFLLYGTAKEIWDAAKETYSSSENTARINTFPLPLQLVFIKSLSSSHSLAHLRSCSSSACLGVLPLLGRSCLSSSSSARLGVLPTFASRLFIIIISSSCQLRGCSSSNHHRRHLYQPPFQIITSSDTIRSNELAFTVRCLTGCKSFKFVNAESDQDESWIVDSGASDHMTRMQHSCTITVLKRGMESGKTIGSAELVSGLYLFRANNPPSRQAGYSSCNMSTSHASPPFVLLPSDSNYIPNPNLKIPSSNSPSSSKHRSTQLESSQLRVYTTRKNKNKKSENIAPLMQFHDFNPNFNHAQVHSSEADHSPELIVLVIDDADVPITLRKGVRYYTSHPIGNFVTYNSLSPAYRAFITSFDSVQILRAIYEALKHLGWQKAVHDEVTVLEKNRTWLIIDLPTRKRLVGCKWIFTTKHKVDESIERLKARLVAKGFTQSYGIDYQETFASVAKLNTIQVLLSLIANFNWSLHQLDIKNAFLNGDLEEEVYMEVPPGIESSHTKSKVCKLLKSLYGVKQSPRAWFVRFAKFVTKCGYIQCQSDHTLFVKFSTEKKIAVLIVYVDDIILTERLKEGIAVTQQKYVLDLLMETGMLGCKPADTPVDSSKKFGTESESVPVDRGSYQRLVERLIYLSHTRPDIGFVVSSVSQFMNNPREEHMEAVYRILRYLKLTPGKGLMYRKNNKREIDVYADADHAGNIMDRCSTSGYCSYVWGNLVTWRSKKQSVVSQSSGESEFRSLAMGICEGIWIHRLLRELGMIDKQPIRLFCDNQAEISNAKNPAHHDRMKHVEIDRYFILEKIENNTVHIVYIPTQHQTTDIFNKALPRTRFEELSCKLSMYNLYNLA
ncbi:retrovirus-related pol polyprotein from transposon RE1 [Citrus sinensis]|uniref:Retrovirus-related pol polyprotein from transposon RE1 n=1 Tax=Citrus sinensis TaxID=2711 RepID=A0ACB8HXF3_CITSI|nr:retrovirus-related pol polyprotein from transposon RE1 [Citrus sinensis]